jgi:uncharacterized protein YjbI with pentapeptide repeats
VDVVAVVVPPASDTIAPTVPSNLSVTTLATTTLGSTIQVTWTDSTDNIGVTGYSFVFDQTASTTPDTIVDTVSTSSVTTLPNGTWYFHIVALDAAGNVSTPVLDSAPIVINNVVTPTDTTAPLGPTVVTSSTHTVNTTSATTSITTSWDTATDDTSLAGYSYMWDQNATGTPDTIVDGITTTYTTNLPNGTWYFHIMSVDTAGNISSPVVDFGPVTIATTTTDTTAPVGPTVVTSPTHTVNLSSSVSAVTTSWDTATDDTSLAGYSYVWDHNPATTPDTVIDTGATTVTTTLPDGTWYFHIISVDTAGNISSPVVDFGPIVISTVIGGDLTPPTTPVLTFTKVGTSTVQATWTDATDNISLAGYSYTIDTNASTVPDAIADTQATTTQAVLPDGVYYFHLHAVDTSFNQSTTVHGGPLTIDTHAPVITLVGNPIVTLLVGTPYIDQGATALDTIEGNLTSSLVTINTVDTNATGTYTVTYDVTDASGNVATQVVRTVHVIATPDTTAPVITLVGTTPVTVLVNTSYVDQGATALDDTDGDITSSIVTASTVTINATGTYAVTYTSTDSSGNIATSTRTVNVIDPTFYNVVSSFTGNGSITPLGTSSVMQSNSLTFTITPNFGHVVSTVFVDGVSVSATGTYSFANVTSDHSIDVTFIPNTIGGPLPTFDVFASAGANGSIAPLATSTITQGNSISYTITPNLGYYVGTLLVDGISVATSTSYTFANINAAHTIDAQFAAYPPDAIPPTPVTVSSLSHAVGVATNNQSAVIDWTASTDAGGSGISGYSYVIDSSSTTMPDVIVETNTLQATTTLSNGTYYFHIDAVDNAGNVSTVTHYGPIVVSDGTVTITNSTIGGTFYAFYAPSVASSTELFLFGTTTLTGVTLSGTWSITDSNLTNTSVSSSTLTNVTGTASTITNSNLISCTLNNAFVKNYAAFGCSVSNSIVDPIGGLNDLTGSTVGGNSQIYFSDVTYSTITGSYIATSTVTNSIFTNSTSTNSTVASSTLTGTVVDLSTVLLSTLTNSFVQNGSSLSGCTLLSSALTHSQAGGAGCTIQTSTLTNTQATTSSVVGSTLTGATTTNSTITNSQATSSTITNSNITGTTIATSTISNSTSTNASVTGSTLTNVTINGTSTTITNSTIENITLTDATVINGVITSGTITLPNGSSTVIATSTPLVDIVNYSPVASFTPASTGLTVTVTDASTDLNNGSNLNDTWTYTWNFGDGTTVTATTSTLGNTQTHTYSTGGTYTITLTITDSAGNTSVKTIGVTVSAPTGGTGGSSGGSGGGGFINGGGYTISGGGSYFTSSTSTTPVPQPYVIILNATTTLTHATTTATSTLSKATSTKQVIKKATVKKKLTLTKLPSKDLELAKATNGESSLWGKIVRFVKHVFLGK